jgi:hypothetical protein
MRNYYHVASDRLYIYRGITQLRYALSTITRHTQFAGVYSMIQTLFQDNLFLYRK